MTTIAHTILGKLSELEQEAMKQMIRENHLDGYIAGMSDMRHRAAYADENINKAYKHRKECREQIEIAAKKMGIV